MHNGQKSQWTEVAGLLLCSRGSDWALGAPIRVNGGTAIKLVNVAKDLGMQQYVAYSSLGVGKSDSAHFCNIPKSVASTTQCD